jgi:predicted Rdx family selenoprotein
MDLKFRQPATLDAGLVVTELQTAALTYIARGWALTWFDYGAKFPERTAWNTAEQVITTPEAAHRRWNGTPYNIGLVHGLGAVKTCSFDVDQVEHTRAVLAEFGIALDALRVGMPCVQGNPANFRLIFRQPAGLDLPLVRLQWPDPTDASKKLVVFELRAGPNQDVLPPSLHPIGKAYEWLTPLPDDPAAHPEPPPALLELWLNWEAWESALQAACPWAKAPKPKAKSHRKTDGANLDVIGQFNAVHGVRELLEAQGYKPKGKNRYLPPNSTSGVPSVRILDSGKVYSDNGSCPLNDGHAHDAFSVFCILEHRGDVRAAVKAAAALLGIELKSSRAGVDQEKSGPRIAVAKGAIAPMLDAAERALIDHCPDLYQRAGMLTRTARVAQELLEHGFKRPAGCLTLLPVTADFLLWRMNQVIQWEKKAPDGPRPADAPRALVGMLLDLAGHWRFPYLAGVVECPTLRRDGTVLIRQGYDPTSGLYLDSGGVEFDPIPDRPTRAQAERALDDLRDVLKDFPYEASQDRAVTLSGILTVPIRHLLNAAPLHAFSATRPGSGKSLQADIAALIATGRTAPAMSQATDETEEEKRLMGILLSGVPLALIDNVNRPLGSDRFCSVLTQQTYKGRVLGLNKNPELPCRLTWFATGNALTLMDDMNDRAIMGFLNPATERPEQQTIGPGWCVACWCIWAKPIPC